MTWSIVARDERSGAFGVTVASKFFSVGSICSYARAGVGALSTQALVNPTYGPRGLRLLAEGLPAAEVVGVLTGLDDGRATRQLHVVDSAGRNAAHTGNDCVGWCGHLIAPGVSVAGNMLAGPRVIEETLKVYRANAGAALPERLLAAMRAGEAAGGDKRGRQSASLLIYSTEEYSDLDIRVDDHNDPLTELERLYRVALSHYVPFKSCLARRSNPTGIYDRDEIMQIVAKAQAAQ